MYPLQQYLPLAVLKLIVASVTILVNSVATVLTACGIETADLIAGKIGNFYSCNSTYRLRYWNFITRANKVASLFVVATVLTACGIETWFFHYQPSIYLSCNSTYRLRYWNIIFDVTLGHFYKLVATVLTVYGIETLNNQQILWDDLTERCNSAYRLRYWNTNANKHFA